jgi:hypothetical protein
VRIPVIASKIGKCVSDIDMRKLVIVCSDGAQKMTQISIISKTIQIEIFAKADEQF